MTTKFKHDHWTKGVTERVNHLRDTFWKFEPSVDIERSVIYTRTYKENRSGGYGYPPGNIFQKLHE